MQHLIKRNVGSKANSGGLKGKTLVEKLAANQRGKAPLDEEEFDLVSEEIALSGENGHEIVNPLSNLDEDVETSHDEASLAKPDRGPAKRRQTGKGSGVCLIADDSRVIRKISSKIAASMGYTVIEAQDGEEALARCKKDMPQLVLTDWNMPEMDGLEFVTRLREIPTAHPPHVIFCTSKGMAADVNMGVRAGANDYIVKPFKEEALRRKLEKVQNG